MLELATPWALIGLPLPLLAWRFLPRATTKHHQAILIPFYHRIAAINKKHQTQQHRPPIWLIMVWILLIFALSGPRWVGMPEPLDQDGHNIMLALDISGSMAIEDMNWHGQTTTRLDVVKRTAESFVQDRRTDRIGLILFGTHAYLQTPLTHDKHTIFLRLDDATVGLAGKATAIGDTIGLAIKHLKHTPKTGRLIILLTDGANNSGVISPLKAAELARDEDIKIYTIGLGSESTQPIMAGFFPVMNGGADLDEETLKTIAKTTKGHYFRATDPESLERIYRLINRMETVSQEHANTRPEHDYYPWPLALSLCLLIIGLLYETGLARQVFYQARSKRRSS